MLLPGLDGSGVLFQPLLEQLSPELRPIVVTYPVDELFGYEQLLPLALGALPHDRPFILLGESFSGPLSLMAAATRPRNLRGVILCASFVQNPVWGRPAWLRHLARPIAFQLFPAVSRVRALFASGQARELRALSAEALSQVRPEVLARRVRAALHVNVLQQLRACDVPILYLLGEHDRVVPRHNAREIVAAHPSVKVVRLAASHWILQTQPRPAAAAIEAFVAEVSR